MVFCLAVFLLLFLLDIAWGAEPAPGKPSKQDKCPVCGMFVSKYPDWIAEVVYKDGKTVFFDGPKDMFKYYFNLKKYDPKRDLGHDRRDLCERVLRHEADPGGRGVLRHRERRLRPNGPRADPPGIQSRGRDIQGGSQRGSHPDVQGCDPEDDRETGLGPNEFEETAACGEYPADVPDRLDGVHTAHVEASRGKAVESAEERNPTQGKGTKPLGEGRPMSDYQALIQQDVFHTTKQRPEADAAQVAEEKPVQVTKLNLKLKGIVVREGSRSFAAILDGATRKEDIYYQNDTIQGARITKILRDQVILEVNNRQEALLLFTQGDEKGRGEAVRPGAADPVRRPGFVQGPPPVAPERSSLGAEKASRLPANIRQRRR